MNRPIWFWLISVCNIFHPINHPFFRLVLALLLTCWKVILTLRWELQPVWVVKFFHHCQVVKNMNAGMSNYGKGTEFEGVTHTWDIVQNELHCCGVEACTILQKLPKKSGKCPIADLSKCNWRITGTRWLDPWKEWNFPCWSSSWQLLCWRAGLISPQVVDNSCTNDE